MNASLYAIIAYWDFFKQFHNNDILLEKPINCDLKPYVKRYETEYEDIYNYLDELSKTPFWDTTNYKEMRKKLEILSKKKYRSSKGDLMFMNFDLPEYSKYGNAQESFDIFLKAIFKECPTSSIITTIPIQTGEKHPFTEDNLTYIEAGSNNPYKYKLIAILKPTEPNPFRTEFEAFRDVDDPKDTVGVSHWTTYVRKGNSKTLKDNKWLYFDMLQGGATDSEYDFSNLAKIFNKTIEPDPSRTKDTVIDNVYHCLFVYLNEKHIA
jgi:hypothetical protein